MNDGCDCANCPLGVEGKPGAIVLPYVPARPSLLVVGNHPYLDAEKPFEGRFAKILRRAAKHAGVSASTIAQTNAILCQGAHNLKPQELRRARNACAPHIDALRKQLCVPTVKLGGSQSRLNVRVDDALGPMVETISGERIFAVPFYERILAAAMHTVRLLKQEWLPSIIHDTPRMQDALYQLAHAKFLAVDIETAGTDPLSAPLLCIGVSDGKTTVSVPWQVDGKQHVWASPATQAALRACLRAPSTKVAHNGAHDFAGLQAAGFDVAGERLDTLLAHAIVAPEALHNLQFVAACEFPVEGWKYDFIEQADEDLKGSAKFSGRDQYDLRTYNGKDCQATAWLVPRLLERLGQVHRGMEQLTRLQRLSEIACKMQARGLPISLEQRAEMEHFLTDYVERLRATAQEIFGPKVNLGAEGGTGDVHRWFFTEHCAPVYNYTETGKEALSKDTLKRWSAECEPPIRDAARALLRFKAYAKLLNSFVRLADPDDERSKGLRPVEADRWHWLRPSWRVWGTISRRFSCSEPNVQQLPFDARAMFHAPPGWVFVEADLAQLEPRITAELSGEPRLIEVFRDGIDLYKQVGAALFSTTPDKIDKNKRQIAKMVWLAAAYGSGPATLQEQLATRGVHVTMAQASAFLKNLARGFPTLARYETEQLKLAERKLYVEEPFGGWRRYFEADCVEAPKVRNFTKQAGAAHLVNDMLIALGEAVNWRDEWIVAQIHDAITLLVPENRAEEWIDKVQTLMYRRLNHVELLAEAQCSREWNEVK